MLRPDPDSRPLARQATVPRCGRTGGNLQVARLGPQPTRPLRPPYAAGCPQRWLLPIDRRPGHQLMGRVTAPDDEFPVHARPLEHVFRGPPGRGLDQVQVLRCPPDGHPRHLGEDRDVPDMDHHESQLGRPGQLRRLG
jgi:hypothetical protein